MVDRTRASDSEREHVVGMLRVAAADGRLTVDELEARTAAAYAAVTRGELSALLSDLPPAPIEHPPGRQPFHATWQTRSDPRLRGGVLDTVVPYFFGHGYRLIMNTPHRLGLQRVYDPRWDVPAAIFLPPIFPPETVTDWVTIDVTVRDGYTTDVYGVAPQHIRQGLATLRA
jgi:hypothetical protein